MAKYYVAQRTESAQAGNEVTQAILPASKRCATPKKVQAGLPASQ